MRESDRRLDEPIGRVGERLEKAGSPVFFFGRGTGGAGGVWGLRDAARSGDLTKGAGGGRGVGRVGDNAHPCAVSPKMAIRGHFTLGDRLLPK